MAGARRRSRRLRIAVGIAAGTVALYAVLGFLVAPAVLRSQMLRRVGDLTERPVSVERVRVNPFALSVTIEGFLVKSREGQPLASFDRLYVNFDLPGLLRKQVGVRELSIDRPYFHPFLDGNGDLNVADVVRKLSASDGKPKPPPKPGGVVFAVGWLRITGAQIDFSDRSRRRAFETTVGPLSLELRNFKTRYVEGDGQYALSGRTESGEQFSWKGVVGIEPIRSRGTFAFEDLRVPKYAPYYQDSTSAEVRQGKLRLEATYDLEWGTDTRRVRIVDGSLALTDLLVGPRGGGEASIELSRFEVSGFQTDVLTSQGSIARVSLGGGRIRARRSRDGRIDLRDLLAPPPADAAAAGGATPGGAVPAAGGSAGASEGPGSAEGGRAPGNATARARSRDEPRALVAELVADGLRVEFTDEVPERPVRIDLDVTRAALARLSSDRGAQAAVDADVRVNGGGRVAVKGTLRPRGRSGDLDLDVEGLELAPFSPYLAGALDARIDQATLGVKGHATFDASGPEPDWTFRGDARIDRLRMAEGERGPEILRWRSLRVDGVDATPARTAVAAVRLLEPSLRVVVSEAGVRNLDVVLRRGAAAPPRAGDGPGGGGGEVAAPAPAPATGASGASEPSPRPWSVGVVQLTRGRASFADRSVKPPATLDVTDLDVVVRGLSSQPRSRAQVRLDARVGGGPVSVSGTLQPRLLGDATDLAVRGKGVDLLALGPYVGKYAGYELLKGKLDVDLRYTVRARTVDGQNLARIDQFTLGEATGSPDATSLPVKLGLAILTDRDGVIDVDLPVSGSVDDPDFSVGRMVWHAAGNLFTKLVTAPFAALGKLFGGGAGESLERVEFQAGSAALDPAAENTLGVLGKALRERPALRLEVEGAADEASDGAAVRRALAQEEVRRAKWSALRARDASLSLDAVTVEPAEYPRWLAAAWKAIPSQPDPAAADGKTAAPRDQKVLPAPEEMEAALAAAVVVPPETFRELAARRAEGARDRLLAGGDLDPARVFVATGGERARKEGGARAWFTLR